MLQKVKEVTGGAKLELDVLNTKKAVQDGEDITTHDVLQTLRKEARTALKEAGVWKQEFHKNEIVGVIAMFKAITKTMQDGN